MSEDDPLRAERERGAADARRDIEAGDPSVVRLEFSAYYDGWVLPGIGLPILSFGCNQGAARRSYRDGYNGVIRAALRSGALEPYRLTHAFTTAESVAAAFRERGGAPLGPGNPVVESPSGRFRLCALPRGEALPQGRWDGFDLEVCDRTKQATHVAGYWHAGPDAVLVLFVLDDEVAWIQDTHRWQVQFLPRWHLVQVFDRDGQPP